MLRKLGRRTKKGTFGLSSSEFEDAFQREKALADRNRRLFSMVIFLPENGEDEEGLKILGEILSNRLRVSDIAGHLDSRTVATLLPDTDGQGATVMADAIMIELAKAGLKFNFKVCAYENGRKRDDDGDTNASSDGANTGGSGDDSSPIRAMSVKADRSLTNADGTQLQWSKLGDIRAGLGGQRIESIRPMCLEPLSFRRRALDIVVAGSALVLASPVFLLVALAVKLTSPGPVFFVQQRAGQGGVPFSFYKFRSMFVDAEARKASLQSENEKDGPIFKIKNDPRLTPIGRFIRRASLDEIPQLFNVLIGDMTLVGPRPPTLDEVEGYEPWQLDRLNLVGGLTCIWQVSGRSDVGFEDWVRMDLRYAQRRGLGMDLGLLARTANAVLTGKGAY